MNQLFSCKKNLNLTMLKFVLGGVFLLILPFFAQSFGNAWVRILDVCLMYTILAVGLNIVVGWVGMLDLGYVAFYAMGAYLYSLFASPHLSENFPFFANLYPEGLKFSFWLMLPLCALFASCMAFILGSPVMKLRGDYLTIVTLGFGEITRIFANNLDAPLNITNGPKGITNVENVNLFGIDFGKSFYLFDYELNSVTLYYFLFLFIAIIVLIICFRLNDSRVGRAWMAIKEDEIAAKAMGLDVKAYKLKAFVIAAGFAGLSGALFASFQGFVSPESFGLMESVMIVAMVILGGAGNIKGVVLGALLLSSLPEILRYVATPLQNLTDGRLDAAILRQLLIAVSMVLITLIRPSGLLPPSAHGKALK